MQDSASNPYIAQESKTIEQQVYKRETPLGRIAKWAAIGTSILAILVGGGLFFVVPHTSAQDQSARQKLADILQPPDQTLKRVNVQSTLGFTFNYDNHVYESYAEVGDKNAGTDESSALATGEHYENNELRVLRAYNYVRVSPIESVDSSRALQPEPPELEVFATFSAADLAKAKQVPENRNLSDLSLFIQLDEDKRQAAKKADDNTFAKLDITKAVSETHGGVDYQKVRYNYTNTNYRVTNVSYDDCYYTIQGTQPYTICVSNVRPNSVSSASLVENIFNSITFQQPQVGNADTLLAKSLRTGVRPLVILAQASSSDTSVSSDDANSDTSTGTSDAASSNSDGIEVESSTGGQSPLITVTPDYYNNAANLRAIAKAQPSVVRIGMIYCANLTLKFLSGETAATLTNACTGSLSNGAIVSSDGYVATTGHAIRSDKKALVTGYINFAPTHEQMLDRLQRILDFLVSARLIGQSDEDFLMTQSDVGNQDALAKIENLASLIPDDQIVAQNENYSYAVQPSGKPIVINKTDTKPTFAYSDSVLSADYVASDYDATKAMKFDFTDESTKADVGLLKINGSYPPMKLAPTINVKSGDTISTIGYPGFSDGSLAIDNNHNLPIVTTSTISQVFDQDGHKFIATTTPVLPGNDGSPVVDSSGNLLGFALYGFSYCPDQQCFAGGTIRPITDLINLLSDKNKTLVDSSLSASNWIKGVDEFFRANYSPATKAFSTAGSLYGYNQWSSDVSKLSQSLIGSKYDTSLMNTLKTLMMWVLAISVVVTIVLFVIFIIQKKRIDHLNTGHYGVPVPNQGQGVAVSGQTNVMSPAYGSPQFNNSPVTQQPSPMTPATPALPSVPPSSQPQQPSLPPQPAMPVNPVPPSVPPAESSPSGPVEDPFFK